MRTFGRAAIAPSGYHIARGRDTYLFEGSLDGELGRVAGVHSADEGVDEPLERFRPKVPRHEFLDALLVVGGWGKHYSDCTETGPAEGAVRQSSPTLGRWFVQFSAVLTVVVAVQRSAVQCTAVLVLCGTAQCTAVLVQCGTVQCSVVRSNKYVSV